MCIGDCVRIGGGVCIGGCVCIGCRTGSLCVCIGDLSVVVCVFSSSQAMLCFGVSLTD